MTLGTAEKYMLLFTSTSDSVHGVNFPLKKSVPKSQLSKLLTSALAPVPGQSFVRGFQAFQNNLGVNTATKQSYQEKHQVCINEAAHRHSQYQR